MSSIKIRRKWSVLYDSYFRNVPTLTEDMLSKELKTYQLSLVAFGRFQAQKARSISNMTLPYHRIIYITGSAVRYQVHETAMILEKGDVLYTPPNTIYNAEIVEKDRLPEFIYLYFEVLPCHQEQNFIRMMETSLKIRVFHALESPVEFYFYTCLAFLITAVILLFPADCLSFALKGLNLWFERMIPTLFPFMVLSGVIIRMDLTDAFVKMLNPILGGLFRIRPACVYGMLVGFLCGFPMGAHVAAQLYEQGQISKAEAAYLLSFCNNIGPVYFLSFVMSVLSLGKPAPFLFGMYGLPFLYGLLLPA